MGAGGGVVAGAVQVQVQEGVEDGGVTYAVVVREAAAAVAGKGKDMGGGGGRQGEAKGG